MTQSSTITIDLAKTVFQVAFFNKFGVLKSNEKMTEHKMLSFIVNHPEALICMEACSSAHYYGRKFEGQGHKVKLLPPHIVAKYRAGNKNDANDALAIYEALKRPNIYSVAVKSISQQDLASLLKLRKGYIKQRTQVSNRARGLGAEYGVKLPEGITSLKKRLPDILEDDGNQLTPASRFILADLLEEVHRLDSKIKHATAQLVELAKSISECELLTSLPGVQWITASALYARLGNGSEYKYGRNASASVGLVPSHSGSGGKNKLHGISKRGDKYLRSLITHGARAVVSNIRDKQDKLSCWIRALSSKHHFNKITIAVANKLVRMALAMLKSATPYRADLA
tara:strand:+ start:48 stop:1070 length:1023 start_codon:yes stop_codon:yes gene_type:complete